MSAPAHIMSAPPSSGLDLEWSLLLAACSAVARPENLDSVHSRLAGPINWASLLDLADQHGVASLLCHVLTQINDNTTGEPMRSLKKSYQTNLRKSLILASELIRILDRLDALGVEVMPYKGLTLSETVYGNMALRQTGDIDLLIRPQDFPQIKNAIRELGYVPHITLSETEERSYLVSGYECAFDSSAGRNLLELQWALQPRFYAVDFDMDGLFRRAIPSTVAGRSVKTLSNEDMLVVFTLHAAKHVWGRLIWLCDIAQIVNLPNLDWDRILGQAEGLGILRILSVTLRLTSTLLGVPPPPPVERKLFGDFASVALTDEIRTQIVSRNSFNPESFAYFRLMIRLRERKADRLKFLRRLALTPGPNEWKAVRLPATLFPLYRLVRLSRLATRLMRA
jgi:Uncharacterised nucleotidyltransferase